MPRVAITIGRSHFPRPNQKGQGFGVHAQLMIRDTARIGRDAPSPGLARVAWGRIGDSMPAHDQLKRGESRPVPAMPEPAALTSGVVKFQQVAP